VLLSVSGVTCLEYNSDGEGASGIGAPAQSASVHLDGFVWIQDPFSEIVADIAALSWSQETHHCTDHGHLGVSTEALEKSVALDLVVRVSQRSSVDLSVESHT